MSGKTELCALVSHTEDCVVCLAQTLHELLSVHWLPLLLCVSMGLQEELVRLLSSGLWLSVLLCVCMA